MGDALTLAHASGHDVFNALDIFENVGVLRGGCAGRGGGGGVVCGGWRGRSREREPVDKRLCRGAAASRLPASSHRSPLPPPSPLPAPLRAADLKFGVGDGKLRYYLFNWRVAREIPPNQVGLVML